MSDKTIATPGLFVTGTDTGVGKTYMTASIAHELSASGCRVGAYKPACSGAESDEADRLHWEDVDALSRATGDRFPAERICPQRFAAPLAPPVAAREEGRLVDARLLRDGLHWWEGRVDIMLVEGVGGLLCPLTESETVADLARDIGYPLLVVARRGLGTINHTLLTVEVAKQRGLAVAGIVLSETRPHASAPATETNAQEIAARAGVPVLGEMRYGSRGLLREERPTTIDWLKLIDEQSGQSPHE